MPAIDPSVVSLVSAATALAASLVGPLVALYVARAQIRATVRSANRQRWIDEFRDTIATFCGQVAAATQVRERLFSDGRAMVSGGGETLQQFERLIATATKIRLLVNPADPEHTRMIVALDGLLALFTVASAGEDVQGRAKAQAMEIAAMGLNVIRHEWARVLRGA